MPGHKARLSLARDPPTNRRPRQKDSQFEANLVYRVSPCLENNQLGSGEMAQWVKRSPYRPEDLSTISTTCMEAESGGFLGLTGHPSVSSRFRERP